MNPSLGGWTPLSVTDVAARFSAAPFRWWIAGGHALELHLGRSWRAHDDVDVGVLRDDARPLAALLSGWDVHVAARGRLTVWSGGPLSAAEGQNGLWCRQRARDPRPKDDLDAAEVIPRLDVARQDALRARLPPGHSWRRFF